MPLVLNVGCVSHKCNDVRFCLTNTGTGGKRIYTKDVFLLHIDIRKVTRRTIKKKKKKNSESHPTPSQRKRKGWRGGGGGEGEGEDKTRERVKERR